MKLIQPGTTLFAGGLLTLGIQDNFHLSWGWTVLLLMVIGWAVNEYERKQAEKRSDS